MSDLEERARRLVDAARPGHNPTAHDAARVRAALSARLLAEPLLIAPLSKHAPPPGPGQAPAGANGVLGKVLIALGVGSALGFAAGLYAAQALWPRQPIAEEPTGDATESARATLDSFEAAPEPAALQHEHETPKTEGTAPSPARPPPRASSVAAPASNPAPVRPLAAPSVSPLKAELDGLRRAQELLYQGRPAWAIARLDELDRARVGSVLLEERAATRAIAECRLGADGSRKAEEYARRFPRSAHLERVRASCSLPRAGTTLPFGETPAQKVAPAQTESHDSPHEE